MRILLASFFFVEYAVELANALGQKNKVHLILCKERIDKTFGEEIRLKLSGNVSLYILPYRSRAHPSTVWCFVKLFLVYLKVRPQIVHLQESSNPLNLFFMIFRFRPLFTTIHDIDLHPGENRDQHEPIKKAIHFFIRTRCYGSIIVHGRNLKKLFLQRYPERRSKDVHIVPHIALFSFLPVGKTVFQKFEEERHTVLFFGRMEVYKGLHYLIQAEPIVTKKLKNFKIIVAGKGEELDAHMEVLKNNSHFEVHGRYISNHEVPTLFQRAAVVVLPYIEASQSGIVAMAFAFGKPVIATDVGSLSEVVINGKNGIIVPARNVEELAAAILALLQDIPLRKQLSIGAKKTVQNLLSRSHVAELTEAAYQSKLTNRTTISSPQEIER